jgi:hypothetical protein
MSDKIEKDNARKEQKIYKQATLEIKTTVKAGPGIIPKRP